MTDEQVLEKQVAELEKSLTDTQVITCGLIASLQVELGKESVQYFVEAIESAKIKMVK